METEINKSLSLNDQQSALVDLHSFVNILNVLSGELDLIALTISDPAALSSSIAQTSRVKSHMDARRFDQGLTESLLTTQVEFTREIELVFAAEPHLRSDPEIQQSLDNIHSVFKVLEVRIAEYLARLKKPDAWLPYDNRKLADNLCNFLGAVEKNSKGRYRIVFNVAAQESTDYLVNLQVQSLHGDTVLMPPVISDVFRDLVANARKYTPPGGSISAGLFDDGETLRLAVEDSGRGIPADELDKVVEFGYRASNVSDVRTKGGGFGLTKAYLTTRRFNGRMWLRSSLGVGTRVTIKIPRPSCQPPASC